MKNAERHKKNNQLAHNRDHNSWECDQANTKRKKVNRQEKGLTGNSRHKKDNNDSNDTNNQNHSSTWQSSMLILYLSLTFRLRMSSANTVVMTWRCAAEVKLWAKADCRFATIRDSWLGRDLTTALKWMSKGRKKKEGRRAKEQKTKEANKREREGWMKRLNWKKSKNSRGNKRKMKQKQRSRRRHTKQLQQFHLHRLMIPTEWRKPSTHLWSSRHRHRHDEPTPRMQAKHTRHHWKRKERRKERKERMGASRKKKKQTTNKRWMNRWKGERDYHRLMNRLQECKQSKHSITKKEEKKDK